jgi:mRNA interferase MazF
VGVCLLTTHLVDAATMRITAVPDESNGLNQTSQIMADKIITAARTRIGKVIGKPDDESMLRLNCALAFVWGRGNEEHLMVSRFQQRLRQR